MVAYKPVLLPSFLAYRFRCNLEAWDHCAYARHWRLHGRLVEAKAPGWKKRIARKASLQDELVAALYAAETVMMIVRPRSHTKEYLATLSTVRAALAKAGEVRR